MHTHTAVGAINPAASAEAGANAPTQPVHGVGAALCRSLHQTLVGLVAPNTLATNAPIHDSDSRSLCWPKNTTVFFAEMVYAAYGVGSHASSRTVPVSSKGQMPKKQSGGQWRISMWALLDHDVGGNLRRRYVLGWIVCVVAWLLAQTQGAQWGWGSSVPFAAPVQGSCLVIPYAYCCVQKPRP